jgi:predicted TIM-barrel fold metal-dependent hydrolase
MSRPCLPPLPPGRRPGFAVPPGATDCHTHVFGPYARWPLDEDRSYTMPETPVETYIAHLDGIGFERGVVVQASVQGTDNACVVDALLRYPQRLRGIAVLRGDTTEAEMDRLHAAGVRGVRLNLSGHMRNGVGLEVLPSLGPKMQARGWHIQCWAYVDRLAEVMPALLPWGMDIVVDHMGRPPPGEAGLAHPGFRLLCDLLQDGRAWVKISGADRVTEGDAPWSGADPIARALIAANADRCVWGSDWPHVSYFPPRAMSEDAALVDRLAEWLPDEALRRRILVDNPARLYGF